MDLPEKPMRTMHLFAGVGGGILADMLLGHRPVCAVEIDPYCQAVLLARQADGCIPAFPIWDDARTFDGRPWRGCVDVVAAGFPCQPFSVAGKRAGSSDERNMWPDTIRILREVGPRYAMLENVPGLLADQYARTIFGDLATMGMDARWGCISARVVGGRILRKRVFVVATTAKVDLARRFGSWNEQRFAEEIRWWGKNSPIGPSGYGPSWTNEPNVGRVAYGVARRVDRIRATGNAQVPGVAATAWRMLTE